MQFGKSVFLSDRTSLPEIGGDAAFYWHDFDPASMSALLQSRMAELENPAEARSQRDAALARARHFSWARCIDSYLAVYRRLLSLERRD